jgi:signal transduction histidine kinase
MKKKLLTLSIIPYLMLGCVLVAFMLMSIQTTHRMELADSSEILRWKMRSMGLAFQQHLHDTTSETWKRQLSSIEDKLQYLELHETFHAAEVVKLREQFENLKITFFQIDQDAASIHDDPSVDRQAQLAINAAMEQSYKLSLLQSASAKNDQRQLILVLVGSILFIFAIKAVIIVSLNRSISRDVQKLRDLEIGLSRSNEELSRFVYFISHDLREPARMVACYMRMLQEKSVIRAATRENLAVDAEADELIRFAIEGAARMEALLDSLLGYARLDSEVEKQEVEFCKEVLDVALRDLRSTIDTSGATVSFACENPDPSHCWHCRITCDPVLMIQVLVNLVGNAIKYAKQDVPPVVQITAKRDAK